MSATVSAKNTLLLFTTVSSRAISIRGNTTIASWKWLKNTLYIEKPENAYSSPPISADCGFLTNLLIYAKANSEQHDILSTSKGAIRYFANSAGNGILSQKNGLPSV